MSLFNVLHAEGCDERHPNAIVYKGSVGLFSKFMGKKYPNMKSLRDLTAIMVSEYEASDSVSF